MILAHQTLAVRDYDLESTLASGQAFRWQLTDNAWEGVIDSRWVRLRQTVPEMIMMEAIGPVSDWKWLTHYLQLDIDLGSILLSFPDDEPIRLSVNACRGLRLLRQDPWECLASFILSSTKQIVQIRQIVGLLCERFGQPVPVPPGHAPVYAFPTAFMHFPPPNGSPLAPNLTCAIVKWAFALRTF
jgi:N-glycosylase/DNA lyase